jgi:uncharacterized protein YlxW (UPF0749 family)
MDNVQVLLLGVLGGGVLSAAVVYFRADGRVLDYRARIRKLRQRRQTLLSEVPRLQSSVRSAAKHLARLQEKQPRIDELRSQYPTRPEF